jgi:hypothetical protein
MIRDNPVLGVGAGHFSHAYYPSRLAWLEARDELGGRGELATHFSWAHCDPLHLVAELGIPGTLWLIALAVACFRVRKRGPPLLVLAAGAVIPFAVLHYPTHLAVGLIPIGLIFAQLLAADGDEVDLTPNPAPLRPAVAFVIVVCALSVAVWQLRVVSLNGWRGGMEALLLSAHSATETQRARIAAAVEMQAASRLQQSPGSASWVLRLVGRARLARGDGSGAESAFRRAYALWPHEEAEFGLGLALGSQGRRDEAMLHLARVCRTNPALVKLITDSDLQRSVRVLSRERTRRNW